MFSEIIKSIVEKAGGSVEKIDLEKSMESINHSFQFNPWNYWLGVMIQKNPLDMMILQEIIFEKKPNTIIECGTARGGSAYYMACLMDLMKIDGQVITIDNEVYQPLPYPQRNLVDMGDEIITIDGDVYHMPVHPKIKYIHSDCLKAELPEMGSRTMVILDCDHSASHVTAELEKFSDIVSLGQYIIVEDTDASDKDNGPAFAVNKFLKNHKNFLVDKSREKYGVSSNLGGYLLRTS